jgi:GNAT superfamily N-acetyltransferase
MPQIRKFIPIESDYQQTVNIEKALAPEEDISIQTWKWHDQHYPPTAVFSRWVGELDGNIVSHGLLTQDESTENNNRYKLHIAVHPQYQGKGYGSELFQHLQRMLHSYAPCTIESMIRADHPYAREFLSHRHFKPGPQKSFYRLNLPEQPAPIDLNSRFSKAENLGVCIFPLQDLLTQVENWKNMLYKLEKKLVEESSDLSLSFPKTQELYEEKTIHQPYFNPESIFIARYQQHWIGTAGIIQSLQKHNCYCHTFTGVEKPYRRNGIATLLKLCCINFAISHGIAHLESNFSEANPIQKINENLGYKRQPWILYERSFS